MLYCELGLRNNVEVGGHIWQHIGNLFLKRQGVAPGDTQLHGQDRIQSNFATSVSETILDPYSACRSYRTGQACYHISTLYTCLVYVYVCVDRNQLVRCT